ncbi:erythromycin esterase family protein [Streptomyces sp. AC495_CC817]|uniref:erythromycin esterase family protein n=1 Tax=Streptomyces sp. AC495_CC817 TaxID=2823900 RepID=UPI001C256F3A|nr:erythromycin esterase family protein [Streptomyces sp. AC495_CC817]
MSEPDIAISKWVRAASASLPAADPDDVTDAQLTPLLDIVGSARVIALGESMHRTHEFLAWRNRLLRFLVEHAGVTAVVLESGFAEARMVDEWIRTGDGRLRSVLNEGITYHFGKCQESLDLVTWMREQHVREGRGPRFHGMDVPASAASALPALLEAIGFLDDADPLYAAHVRNGLLASFDHLPSDTSGLAWAATAIQSYLGLDPSERHAITSGISGLVERMRAKRTDYVRAGADHESTSRAIRCAEVARGADAFLSAMTEGPTRTWSAANIRDSTMADSVEWVLDREPRVLLFAANGHVRRTPYLAPPFVSEPLATVGTHLSQRLADDYRVIGTTFGGGEAWLHRPSPDDLAGHSTPFTEALPAPQDDSLDAMLSRAAPGSFLVDLAGAPGALDRAAGTHNGPELELADVRASFDAILHVERISPWHTWIDGRGRWA